MNLSLFPRMLACAIAVVPAAVLAQGGKPCDVQNTAAQARACAEQHYQAEDRQLNSVYQAVIKQLDSYHDNGAATKKALILSQRKWVEFRDADCGAQQRLYQGGSVAPDMYLQCMLERTEQRIKELDPSSWAAG